jgi:hypothetical protein
MVTCTRSAAKSASTADSPTARSMLCPKGTGRCRTGVKGVSPEPCREGAMTTSQIRAPSKRAGALLGAIAILVTGCMAPGAGGGPRSGRAGAAPDTIATSPSGHSLPYRITGTTRTTGPRGVRHATGPMVARASPLSGCAVTAGHPVMYSAGPASRSPVALPICPCCLWCACAWVCCGCGPGSGSPERWSSRSPVAWQCCWRWPPPPSRGGSPIPPTCWPGCTQRACPTWRQATVPGPARTAAPSRQQVGGPGGGQMTSHV